MAWHLTAAERSANAKKAAATRRARHEDNWHPHGKSSSSKSSKTSHKTTKSTTHSKASSVTGTKRAKAVRRVSFAKMDAVARLAKYTQK